MIMIDSIVRLRKGVLNNFSSATKDSFYSPLLDGPHYTRPRSFRGLDVPDILLSGNHEEIKSWFLNERELKTKKLRKDLWKKRIDSNIAFIHSEHEKSKNEIAGWASDFLM